MTTSATTARADAGTVRSAAALVCIGFEGTAIDPRTAEWLREGVAGVILFARNFVDRAQVAELCEEILRVADRNVIIAVDHEGGRVQRFKGPGFTTLPAARLIRSVEEAEAAGETAARELRAIGVNLDFAPVLDVDSNPANPVIGDRSFGRDPALVARCGAAFIRGLQSEGVAACGKHFPGHGDTALDSHLDLPHVTHDRARLDAIELPPFRAAIEAGVASIMTAHVLFDAIEANVPATMSRACLEGLLRGELGFEGVIVSDDLDMKAISDRFEVGEAAVRSVEAGVDLLLCCRDPIHRDRAIESLAAAIASGRIDKARLERARARIDRLVNEFS